MFFFKQKTAYESRISDGSSDVCSSDLLACEVILEERTGSKAIDYTRSGNVLLDELLGAKIRRVPAGTGMNLAIDRQSVVSGKSASVRVDLGGRRIIQTQQT